jgi:alcohol dehydrogenase
MDHAILHIQTRLVFGENSVDSLGEWARKCGGRKGVFVVTDRGVADAGHAERAMASLTAAGLRPVLFDRVHENPTTVDVDASVQAARDADIDLIVGLGGGSALDTAKGCNFILTNGGRMQDYWGVGKATRSMLPFIAVPTTTGTGSEMQSFALIADAETHQKMACGDKKAAARVAILDPTLSATQPRDVIAHTGLDCMAHALETAVTTRRQPFSVLFARDAWRLAYGHFRRVLEEPGHLRTQGRMLLASAYAGIAIEHSMLGCAHALANPLTAHFDIVHGQAVGMMLPHVVRFNAADAGARAEYARLAQFADPLSAALSDGQAPEALLAQIRSVLAAADMPTTLAECGISADSIDMLAAEAARQWTAQFNPRPATIDDFRAMYVAALEG